VEGKKQPTAYSGEVEFTTRLWGTERVLAHLADTSPSFARTFCHFINTLGALKYATALTDVGKELCLQGRSTMAVVRAQVAICENHSGELPRTFAEVTLYFVSIELLCSLEDDVFT